MRSKLIEKIFRDTAYVRMGGSAEEKRTAEYIKGVCAEFGGEAKNAYTYQMTRANGNQHPNLEEHAQYTEDLLTLMGYADW